MYRLFALYLSLSITSALASHTFLDIFPSGQGNAILVKHHHQNMLIDAGRTEAKYSAAYHAKATVTPTQYKLFPAGSASAAVIPQFAGMTLRSEDDPHNASFATTSAPNSASDDSAASDDDAATSKKKMPESKRAVLEKQRKSYEEELIEQMRMAILNEEKTFLHLKTLVVTHPDKDHYNLIPRIFSADQIFRIDNIILGGFYWQYNEAFRNWLDEARDNFGSEPIFTGMADGGRGGREGMASAPGGYARSYCSVIASMEKITETEQRIEQALKWTPEGDETAPPAFEILAMNSGHVERTLGGKSIVQIVNADKNVNSIVLRLSNVAHPILLTGDAEEATWGHIEAFQKLLNDMGIERNLKSDYVLLSHHGSNENGAVPLRLLRDAIQPKALFASVGRHQKYHHPAQKTIDSALGLGSLWEEAGRHPVSYFTPKPHSHRRRHLSHGIFSTLNSGHIHLDLNEPGIDVHTSQVKGMTYTETTAAPEGGGPHAPRKFEVNYSQVYIPNTGTDAREAAMDIARQLQAEQIHVTLWEKDSPKGKSIHVLDNFPSPGEPNDWVNILIDRDGSKLYFLDTIDADVGVTSADSHSAPAEPTDTHEETVDTE